MGVNIRQESDSAQQPLFSPSRRASAEIESSAPHASTSSGSHAWVAEELRKIGALALPLLLQNVCSYLIPVLSAAFVGHLGPGVLSSVTLGASLYNVTGFSILFGLSAGMETLCGQAYGASNYKMLGLILQRAALLCLAFCVPISLLWLNIEPLLLAAHQDPVVAAGAARYLRLVSPVLIAVVLSSCLNKYLIAQQVVTPTTVASVVTALLCPVFNWYLIFSLKLGLDGAAYANMLSQACTAVMLLGYVVYREGSMAGAPESAWPGLQLAHALDPPALLQYMKYGGTAAAMICLEWWAFELVIILSGTVKEGADVAVSTMGVTFLIISFLYMLPMAFGVSLNTRIANELGAGNALGARRSFNLTLTLVLSMALTYTTALWLLRGQVARIFTKDPDVTAAVGAVMPVLCFGTIGDGLNAVLSNTLRGCGRQALGAVLNLVGWWVIVVPLAVVLGLRLGLGPWGFWVALASGTCFQAMVFLVVVSRFNWQHEVQRALDLVATHGHPAGQQCQLSFSNCKGSKHDGNGKEEKGDLEATPLLMRTAV